MSQEKEYGHKLRLLLVLRALLERPRHYTKRSLASKFGVHPDTIGNYFTDFKNAGFDLVKDEKHCYRFESDPVYEALQDLLHFTEHDQDYLIQALYNFDRQSEGSERIQRKVSAIYDFTKLGYENLRSPHLAKINLLQQAKADKRRVNLMGYHSSHGSDIRDRLVEPFHVSPEEDILHALDVEIEKIRHFRISRIGHILPVDEDWDFESKHQIMPTDPFRIVDAHPVHVHLRLSVGAYNELLERFPLTRMYIRPAAEPDKFDFEAKVNSKFYGLANFILGNYHLNVEVVSPDELKDHLRGMVRGMNF